MKVRVYGIHSCDACRKARRWLDDKEIEYECSDLRADGIDAGRIDRWLACVGEGRLVNRRSTTWRQLPEDRRAALADSNLAEFLAEHPTLIKRPVFEREGIVVSGFDDGVRAWLAGT
jgi:arsenate reductase